MLIMTFLEEAASFFLAFYFMVKSIIIKTGRVIISSNFENNAVNLLSGELYSLVGGFSSNLNWSISVAFLNIG